MKCKLYRFNTKFYHYSKSNTTVSSAATALIATELCKLYYQSATTGTTFIWDRATVVGITETGVTGQSSNPILETLTNTTYAPIMLLMLLPNWASNYKLLWCS